MTPSSFADQTVLVTGACGTIGSELVRQMVEDYRVGQIIGIDNNESELFFLEQRFASFKGGTFRLADIRDLHKLERIMRGVDTVFHAAAYKHVILCERTPFEAVQTNILGVHNVINAATAAGVKRVIFTSSDKAVNPTNVMGTSKLMGERLMTAAGYGKAGREPVLASTRFGNVLGSRGSVIPIFREQIRKGGPVTLTHPDMTRFIMSIRQAVRLVIDSALLACGGEVFITKMPVIRIKDLAEVMIRLLAPCYGHRPEDIAVETIGTKPGEKMYEELMTQEETRRTWELPQYFAVLPAYYDPADPSGYDFPDIISRSVSNEYISQNETALTQDELAAFLRDNRLLEEIEVVPAQSAERYWPDIKADEDR